MTSVLQLDGASLRCADVVQVVGGGATVRVVPAARHRAELACRLAEQLVAVRPIYGRSTGVGGNRDELVDADAAPDHGVRLLRSHAAEAGEPMAPEQVRALLAIRLNQLAAGRSGAHPRIIDALEAALRTGAEPLVHRVGAIGTGDLTALADVGLALAGERPWASAGHPPVEPVAIGAGDALALMSSNAATLAEAVLAHDALALLLRASHAVCALSYIALAGSPEAYAPTVHRARPHRGQLACAAELRRLLGMVGVPGPSARIQDPYGLRAFPQVQGPALDAADALERVLDVELNASTENPMVSVEDGDVFHHGHFHTAYVAVALDQLRATIHHVAELSVARLSDLLEPTFTDLPAFLAAGPPGSSGLTILEYVAHDALAQLRQAALPATLGTAIVSRGLEDHASFSTQAARAASQVAVAYRQVLACELLAAVRALRLRRAELLDTPIRAGYELAARELDPSFEDRALSGDLERAERVLARLASV